MRRVVGVNLFERARASQERSLLARAKADDEAAAAELLFCYSHWQIFDKGVRSEIEEGSRSVAASVVSASTLPGARAVEVQPLMYFTGRQRKRGKKAVGAADGLLSLRLWSGELLSADDMREALTTQWENTTSRSDKPTKWPSRSHWKKTIGDVEERLIEYVVCYRFKGTGIQMASKYVRESFPSIDWNDDGGALFNYPNDW